MRILLPLIPLVLNLAAYAGPITTVSLIEEMTDLARLTRFPAPGYKTIQYSSYDRRSNVPGGPNWFANSDGFGEEPIPNFETVIAAPQGKTPGEYLICDVPGPGAIVRLWTAQIAGDIRVYLDGNATPLYSGPAEAFLRYPYDSFLEGTGLSPADLKNTFYQRDAAYAPIPFARQCRIVWIGNHRDTHFYQIQVRRYAPGTELTTFSPKDLIAGASSIRKAAAALNSPDATPENGAQSPVALSVTAPPKSRVTALELKGPGVLQSLTLKVDAPQRDRALRQTVLYIQCDGDPWGQVQSPAGDFFGAGPGINPYTSAPFTVAADGLMTCRFPMPYKESVHILFENHGDQEVTLTGSVHPGDYAWDDAASMHFHACWRVDHDRVASNEEVMGAQDLPFLFADGQGVYAGTAIMLLNPAVVPTEWGNWWGEGDEKIFVDDDVRPSTFGTGTEDYFNYSWSASGLFAFPYCGQPRNDGPANRGFVVNYRWHILDPLPFRNNLSFRMELFSHERTEGFSYGRISYYYARPGAMSDHIPLTTADLRMPELPATWDPAPRFGAMRWDVHACEDLMESRDATELRPGGMWQGGQAAVWTPIEGALTKTLRFEIPEKGNYRLLLACMFLPGGGAFHVTLDGKPIAFEGKDTIDLNVGHGLRSRVLGAEATRLRAGKHELLLTAETPGKTIGLDFLVLRKQ
ncbi:MAG: DUF2961 domain-containing protein [Candidatus Hydrogenedentes bacterium]|nr:DUF2961 domain-containing protein [Candidatus Hydrogenedentota bacterium]